MHRICVVLVDRANYGRLLPIMDAIEMHKRFELQTVVGGSMLLQRFRMPVAGLSYRVDGCVYCEVEGSMAMSIGLATQGFAQQFKRLRPDYIVIIGDRFETLGAATAAACLRIPLIHFQGGEISGCLDNKWRHAITQLADYHVPAARLARDRIVLQSNGNADDLCIGCPSSDLAATITASPQPHGQLMVTYHPDTATDADYAAEMDEVLEAVSMYSTTVWWPNIDEGSAEIAKTIRRWQHDNHADFATAINLPPLEYLQRLADTCCCVGNSSSFVRDAGFFGTPVVLVGTRQNGRECGENVIRVDADADQIKAAISTQLRHGRYEPSTLYGDGHVAERFIKALEELCGIVDSCTV